MDVRRATGLLASARARARSFIADVARSLPPPRDLALVTFATAAWTLLTGRGPGSGGRDVAASPIAVYRARRALRQGRPEAAHRAAAAILREHPDSPGALDVDRMALSRLGELTAAAQVTGRLLRQRRDPAIAAWERRLVGRLVETDPSWLPRIAGGPQPMAEAVDGRVLHLLKESLPYRQNGFTMRSRYTLLAQREAGLDPNVVTSLGFPRNVGVEPVPPVEEVDGIPHYRLDAGPDYPTDPPVDELLTDQAWMTARLARDVRAQLIHAGSGHRGYEVALVGLAVARHLGRPLVYEVRSFFETTWSSDPSVLERGEYSRRRHEAETRAMRSADAVITIADAMRDEIVERGVPATRVFVIPNGVDPSAFAPRPRDDGLARSLGIDGRATFGYVSNLDHPRENQELLIEATARLRAGGRRVACLIVGDGRRRTELEAIARARGVAGDVVFTGAVPHDRVADYYGLMDVFVVPRRDERAARFVTPLKPFEAMALGRPLVVANLPSLTEIAQPDERGLAFRAGDAAALAAAVERCLDEPDQARARTERARAWVTTERTWAANGRRYRDVYDAVLRGELAGVG